MSERSFNKSILSSISSSVIDDEEKYVTCPYDKAHRILRARLNAHLMRCARNHSGAKLIRCPFNSTHLQRPDELQSHIYECEDRQTFARFCYLDKLPPQNPTGNIATGLVDTTENWDDEPDVTTYNPQAYCEQNVLIRNLQGASKSARREYRENERRRFKENKFV